MFISIHDKSTKKLAFRTHVINKDTGQEIRHVIWANTSSGLYKKLITDKNGTFCLNKEKTGVVSKIFIGNIEFRFDEI